MTAFVAVICGVFGLAVGSFLNVVIHRVPKKESVVTPRSRCPACGTELAARDNIPVVSWLLLRGKCRTCAAPISVRYPLVEVANGVLWAAIGARFGADWALPAYLVLAASLLAITVIDLELYIIPNRIVYPTLFVGAPLLVLAAFLNDDGSAVRRAAIGGAAAFAALFLIHVISPRGMGFGDVRLSGLLGMYLGWIDLSLVFLGLFLGFLLGAVVGLTLMVVGRKGRKDAVPFGPFLAAGAILAVLFSDPLLRAYSF